jgi:hypothetical protein
VSRERKQRRFFLFFLHPFFALFPFFLPKNSGVEAAPSDTGSANSANVEREQQRFALFFFFPKKNSALAAAPSDACSASAER